MWEGPSMCFQLRSHLPTMRYLQQYGRQFGVLGFEDSLPTIHFVEMIRKWFNIHNIRSTTFYMINRNPDQMPFSSSIDDGYSYWLIVGTNSTSFSNGKHSFKGSSGWRTTSCSSLQPGRNQHLTSALSFSWRPTRRFRSPHGLLWSPQGSFWIPGSCTCSQ